MDNDKKILLVVGAVVLLLLAPGIIQSATMTNANDILTASAQLIPQFEGFRATPYWDVSRYSWGYGTRAPGPDGTITREQAAEDLKMHVENDLNTLYPRITRPLLINQWAALMSFAYEEGTGNPGAGALVNDINADNDAVLETHWKKYIYADGVVDPNIVARRNREWEIWTS